MATKIKIFKYADTDMLETKVNEFCDTHDIINIQYEMSLNPAASAWYSCCITYVIEDVKRAAKTFGQEDDL